MKATYNITKDLLQVWFDARLSETEYKAMREARFTFWHGSKCFAAKWSPEAEDAIVSHGIEIEEDDSPDDVEARVGRFAGYAEDAEKQADSARIYLDSERANTERRKRNGINALKDGVDAEQHWQQRIQGAIRHATMKESPGVIMRRIEGLETDLRRHEVYLGEPQEKTQDRDGSISCWFGRGRGGSWIQKKRLPAVRQHAQRWADHINARLLYERALLAATGDVRGKLLSNEVQIEVGGAVQVSKWWIDGWAYVCKVNPSTVDIFAPTRSGNYHRMERSRIEEVASKVQVDAGEVECPKPPAETVERLNSRKIEKATTKDGLRPEKYGAYGIQSGYATEPGDWCLIVKVNAKSFDYVYPFEERLMILADGKQVPQVRRGIRKIKMHIHRSAKFKTAEEVAQIPALMEVKTKWEAILAKQKEAAK